MSVVSMSLGGKPTLTLRRPEGMAVALETTSRRSAMVELAIKPSRDFSPPLDWHRSRSAEDIVFCAKLTQRLQCKVLVKESDTTDQPMVMLNLGRALKVKQR